MKKKLLLYGLSIGLIAFTGIASAQKQMKKNSTLTQDELAGNNFYSGNTIRTSANLPVTKKPSSFKGIPPAILGCDMLSTAFAGGNGNAGNMFDITATTSIVINSFEGNISGSGYMKIYYKAGTFAGSETTPSDWTLVDSTMVISAGTNVPTFINIPMNIAIPAGQTYGFYFTGNGSGAMVAYTNGTTQGAVLASNAALQIFEGIGIAYPFGASYTPRDWNGIVHYCDSGSLPPPAAVFKADMPIQCAGNSIKFSDLSSFIPTAWNWNFPGGNPVTSNLQNPVVNYGSTGSYDVTLIASNANGNDTLTMTNYVRIINGSGSVPTVEDFESATFPSANYFLYDDRNDGNTWMHSTTVSGFGVGTSSAYFDNYNADLTGTKDALRTQKTDLSAFNAPMLYFDVAYSPFDTTFSDTLAIYASTNCETNFMLLYLKGGKQLSADSSAATSEFIPTAAQWRTDSIDLWKFAGQSGVTFSFENRSHYGNDLYLDNINIKQGVGSGISEQKNAFEIQVTPNPMSQKAIIALQNSRLNKNEIVLVNVYELTGKLVKAIKPTSFSNGKWIAELNRENLAPGMYFIQISANGKSAGTSKIVVE